MPLTDTAIKNAKPSDKTRRMYDSGGLYLEVSPQGGKWWRLKYRFQGKEKRLSLGTYPDVSLKLARVKRDEARTLLSSSIDPSHHRKQVKIGELDKTANSFNLIYQEWYSKHSPNWSESHRTRLARLLERDVMPWIGKHPIADITAQQLLEVVRRIENRGALETAHRALQNCGQVFRYAVATGRVGRDPTSDLRGALPPYKGKHFSSVTEPKQAAEILRAIDSY